MKVSNSNIYTVGIGLCRKKEDGTVERISTNVYEGVTDIPEGWEIDQDMHPGMNMPDGVTLIGAPEPRSEPEAQAETPAEPPAEEAAQETPAEEQSAESEPQDKTDDTQSSAETGAGIEHGVKANRRNNRNQGNRRN